MSPTSDRQRLRRLLVVTAILAVAVTVAAAAQFGGQRGRRGGGGGGGGRGGGGGFGGGGFGQGRLPEGRAVPPRYPPAEFEDGAFTVCKIQYTSVTREAEGAGWSTDYPYAGINLMTRLSELTKTPVSRDDQGFPNYWVVRLTDPALFQCPFTMGSDVGTIGLSTEEAAALRLYLLKGGFLWVDDFWGTPAWEQWSAAMHNAQERGSDSPYANFRMIANEHGRIMVVMTHNTDIGDSWEREGEDHDFFIRFSPPGYQLGMDVLLYAMTH